MLTRILLLLLLLLATTLSYAQWQPDGLLMCGAANHQLNHVVVSDSGGAIVVWEDYRSGEADIYARKVNASGTQLWAADGIAVCSVIKPQFNPVAVSDGAGGVIVVWEDYRIALNSADIYAQRISPTGTLLWNPLGVLICSAANVQMRPAIISDGQGGAIIAWEDYRGGLGDIYAQRVSSNGAVLWQNDGVPLATVSGTRYAPVIATDAAGGALVAWEENRVGTEYDIYAQRVNGSGALQWGAGGIAVCTSAGVQMQLTGYSTGTGTMLLAWQDYRNTSADIYAHILNPQGLAFIGSGAAVCTDAATQEAPRVAPDGTGGMIVAWADYRVAAGDIYARRVSSAGVLQWSADGVPLCTQAATQHAVDIAPRDSGGVVVAWMDYRNARGDVYTQAVNNNGSILWLMNGSPVCTNTAAQQRPMLARDRLNGVYVAWTDYRNGTADVFVQRVNRYGTGLPVELLSFAADRSGEDVVLRWRTAAEVNVHGFEVQSAVEGQFSTQGFVPARAADGARYEYTVMATNATLYRLRIVDNDGSESYSPELTLAATRPSRMSIVSLSPLPAVETVTITLDLLSDEPGQITIYDLTGRIRLQHRMDQFSRGREVRTLDVSSLPAAVYMLEVTSGQRRDVALFPVRR
ncbi:MAG: T9SS type A sorting domain-containing protein [Bacteroidia bacterium]|nr:T9SS type A sorting domain-containing protein [Bacteroidia bacterium]